MTLTKVKGWSGRRAIFRKHKVGHAALFSLFLSYISHSLHMAIVPPVTQLVLRYWDDRRFPVSAEAWSVQQPSFSAKDSSFVLLWGKKITRQRYKCDGRKVSTGWRWRRERDTDALQTPAVFIKPNSLRSSSLNGGRLCSIWSQATVTLVPKQQRQHQYGDRPSLFWWKSRDCKE